MALVFGVEADADERIEEREHEGPVVAPGARRLVVRAMTAQLHDSSRVRIGELVWHADRVADEVAVDRGADRVSHRRVPPTGGERRSRGIRSQVTRDR